MHAVGFWIGAAIDHLAVDDMRRHIRAAHRPHRHTYAFAFHDERLAVTRRIKAGQAQAAARSMPPCHSQPRFLLHLLNPGRRCQIFLLQHPRLVRTEPGDLTSADALAARRKFDEYRFLRMYLSFARLTHAILLLLKLVSRRRCGEREQCRQRDECDWKRRMKRRSAWRTVLFIVHGKACWDSREASKAVRRSLQTTISATMQFVVTDCSCCDVVFSV